MAASTRRHLKSLLKTLAANYPADKNYVFPERWRKHKYGSFVCANAWEMFAAHTIRSKVLLKLSALRKHGKALALLDGLPAFMVGASACDSEALITPMSERSFERIIQKQSPGPFLRKRPVAARRGVVRHFPMRGHEGFNQVEDIRKSIGRNDTLVERRAIAEDLRKLLGAKPTVGTFVNREEAISYNIWCFGQWLLQLLLNSEIAAGSILTWTSAIAAHFFPIFGERSISQWNSEDWTQATGTAMAEHQSDATKRSFRRFYSFARSRQLTPMLPERIKWNSKLLRKVSPKQPVPVVSFSEFDLALRASSSESVPPHLRSIVRVMLILGFYCGLRSSEAVRLRMRDLQIVPEPALLIRDSKTAHGSRNLYLRRLMPARHLQELLGFARHRAQDLGPNSPNAVLLGRKGRTEHYDSSYLSSMAGIALRRVVPEPMCYHQLRHSFASWMLLRLMVVSGLIRLDKKRFDFAKSDVFKKQLCSDLKVLLYGFAPTKTGQQYVSHILVVLCRLLGHSHPLTSLNTYVHTTDIAMHLFMRQMSSVQAKGGNPSSK